MIEIWRDIPGLEGRYQASTLGRIKSLSRRVNTWNAHKTIPECILKDAVGTSGYKQVRIDGRSKSVHRLIALTFIPIPNPNCTQVNHLDEDKTNNSVKNLEWCTPKHNINWGTSLVRRSKTQRNKGSQLNNRGTSRPVICVDNGATFLSIADASRKTGIDGSSISQCCKGRRPITHGLRWRYL